MKKLDQDFRDHFKESENYYTTKTADEEKLKSFLEQSIQSKETLFEHLTQQSKESFDCPKDLAIAEVIIGSLDEKGYLLSSLNEIGLLNTFNVSDLERILKVIQTFEPFGVGARDLRECLLLQLSFP